MSRSMRFLGDAVAVAVAAAVALAGSLLAGAPASGRVLEHEHVVGPDAHIEQEAHPGFCPDVPFLVLFHADFREHRLWRVKGNSEFEHFSSNYRARETYTNVENGKALTFRVSANGGDRRIVDNGDGTIAITFALTGRTRMFGPDGTRLASDSGQFRGRVVVDTNGTVDPEDDTEVSFELLKETGLADEFADRDFCADLVTFLS